MGSTLPNNHSNYKSDSLFSLITPLYSSIKFTKKLKKNYRVSILSKENATFSKFELKSKNAKFIHLDTHTFISEDNLFTKSRIAFTNDDNKKENTLITLNKLLDTNINPKVLILGSCSTGNGKSELGEEFTNLVYNFNIKGVETLVYTLWNVNETSTHEVMEYFYEFLAQGLPMDYSLQEAKLKYIKSNSDWRSAFNAAPYYWAGLSLSGVTLEISIDKSKGSPLLIFLTLFLVLACIFIFLFIKSTRLIDT